jgi:hypothetical protein
VICPAEITAKIRRLQDGTGIAKFAEHCSTCPLVTQCTTSGLGRKFRVGVNEASLARPRGAGQSHVVRRLPRHVSEGRAKDCASYETPTRRTTSPGVRHYQSRRRLQTVSRSGQSGAPRCARGSRRPKDGNWRAGETDNGLLRRAFMTFWHHDKEQITKITPIPPSTFPELNTDSASSNDPCRNAHLTPAS